MIAVYPNGLAIIYDPSGPHSVKMGQEEPIEFLEETEENLEKYFPNLKKPTISIK